MQISMMTPTENERLSLLLSTYLERRFTGTEESLNIHRKTIALREYLNSNEHFDKIFSGSYGEGCFQLGSDQDAMLVFKSVSVLYPDQSISQNLEHKTVLYIRQANCRPGFVHLQIGHLKHPLNKIFSDSIVRIGSSLFISSDIFREGLVTSLNSETNYTGLKFESNGPSTTLQGGDIVSCFPCSCWPKEANEWITRTRLYGWPHQSLIEKIVNSGCHIVPVGDKCSEDTLLQWRISFALPERSLVHSFSYIQVKVYTLLKYFLKQIKEALKETIGDDDILCSYFLKTILFHAIENTSQMFWQDKNLFYCFWFCFNILIAWVRAGFCPHYFIPANNLFKRKVHGQNQQILLDLLDNYCCLKWMCLSVGNFHKPTIWENLCDTSIQAQLERPMTEKANLMYQDITALHFMSPSFFPSGTIKKAFNLLYKSKSDFEEVYAYHITMCSIRRFASEMIYEDLSENGANPGNKTRYRRLRKCKYWVTRSASMGTEVLHLATFHFLMGNFSKCLEISRQVIHLASCYGTGSQVNRVQQTVYRNQHYQPGGHALERLEKICNSCIQFCCGSMHLPHLCLELSKKNIELLIPPLPYVLFLNFLCCHELGDSRGREEALYHLIKVQYDEEQGGCKYWIVHTLLGICYQTLGDFQRAIRAYWESAQSGTPSFEWNTAIDRIAIVYLCMYVSKRSVRG